MFRLTELDGRALWRFAATVDPAVSDMFQSHEVPPDCSATRVALLAKVGQP